MAQTTDEEIIFDDEYENDIENEELDEKLDEEKNDESENEQTTVEEEKYEDKYIRLLAEFDNFKKRNAKEALIERDRGKNEVFTQIVGSLDTLEKAIEQIEVEDDFTKGIRMTYDNLLRSMKSCGLEEVSYEKFDPNVHMAVMTESNEDKEDDEILDVLQKGYVINKILVRQAMVKVNKK